MARYRAARTALLALPLLLCSPPARCAESGTQAPEAIVVTALRYRSALKDTPAFATVISSADIARTSGRGIEEVLPKLAADVDVEGSAFSQTLTRQVLLRGVGDQSRTMILIDGVPIASARNRWVDWALADVPHIDRVEILRGPFSSLYGSGAMGGVVHILTKTPASPSETAAEISFGSFDTKKATAWQGGRRGPFAYAVSGTFLRTKGFVAETAPASFNVARSREEWNYTAKLTYSPGPDSSWTAGSLNARDRFGLGQPFYGDTTDHHVGYLRYDRRWGKASLQARSYLDNLAETQDYNATTNRYILNSQRFANMSNVGGSLLASYETGSWGTISGGLDGHSGRTGEATRYLTSTRGLGGGGNTAYIGPFLQDQTAFLDDRLVVTVGARLDWYRVYAGYFSDTNGAVADRYPAREFSSLSPRLGAAYHWDPDTTLRFSAGRAFAAPLISNLYLPIQKPGGNILPNAGLDPEKLWSYEAGVDRKLRPGLLGRLTFHQDFGSDFVARFPAAGGNTQWGNVTNVDFFGVDSELDFSPSPRWRLRAGHSWLRAKMSRSDGTPALVGGDFVFAAPNRALLGATYDEPRLLTAQATLRYKDHAFGTVDHSIMARSYWTLDIGLARQLAPWLTAKVDLENAADSRYGVYDYANSNMARAAGRVVTGRLSASF